MIFQLHLYECSGRRGSPLEKEPLAACNATAPSKHKVTAENQKFSGLFLPFHVQAFFQLFYILLLSHDNHHIARVDNIVAPGRGV